MSITKTREVFSLPNVHYAEIFNIKVTIYNYATSTIVGIA